MKQQFQKKDLVRIIILFAATVVVAGACSMPFEWAGSMPDSWDDASTGTAEDEDGAGVGMQVMTISGPSFTLAWDSGSDSVAGFRIYSRQHGASDWQVLAQNVSESQLTISESDLPYGVYEFAVSSLSADGLESDLHHSYDETADPEPWILEWTAL